MDDTANDKADVVVLKATSIPWQTRPEGRKVKQIMTLATGGSPDFAVVVATTPYGSENSWHQREWAEFVMVLEGQASFSYKSSTGEISTIHLEKFDCVYVPKGVWHKNANGGKDTQVIIGINSPSGVYNPGTQAG